MIELYDILTLEDDNDYAVIKIANIDNDEYYLLNKVDEEEELVDDPIIVKKALVENEIGVIPISSDKEYEKVKKVFADMLFKEE